MYNEMPSLQSGLRNIWCPGIIINLKAFDTAVPGCCRCVNARRATRIGQGIRLLTGFSVHIHNIASWILEFNAKINLFGWLLMSDSWEINTKFHQIVMGQKMKKCLTAITGCDIIIKLSTTVRGLVAQLDRVFDYESKGRGFESRRAHSIGGSEKSLRSFYFQRLQRF